MYEYTRNRAAARNKWDVLVSIYGTTCAYCHENYATQIDHVIPVSWKLSNHIDNLRPCCEWCNLAMGDKVFETFDDKYEWLREQRLRRNIGKQKRTVCTVCRLPYQRPLHSPNLFLCASCYDTEYRKAFSLKPQWKQWLELCRRAGFIIEAHQDLAAWHRSLYGTSITKQQRARQLAEFYSYYQAWEIEGITMLREEPAPYHVESENVYLFE